MEFQGRFFRFLRCAVRKLNIAQYDTPARERFIEPAVYICRHSNLKGPILSMVNLPMPVHPWAYYVWCDKEACRKQCSEFTFSVRFGWRKWIADAVAWLIAAPFSGLIRSAGSIPVYRNSLRVRETFKLSVEALKKGESLLIFPDVNYTTQLGDAGELYQGFLMLERMYFKEMGKHLPFVPMHISDEERKLVLDEPVLFRDDVPFKEDKDRVIRALHDALNDMMEAHGT